MLGLGVVAAIAVGCLVAEVYLRHRVGRDALVVAARELQLTVSATRDAGARAVGRVDGLRVELNVAERARGCRYSIVVELPPGVPAGIRCERRGSQRHPVLLTGDSEFDATVAIAGGQGALSALLDDRTRARLLREVKSGVTIASGEARLAHVELGRASAARRGREMATETVELVELAWGLELREADLAARLSHSARLDPLESVRFQCLYQLARYYDDTDELLAASRAALDADDPGLRALGGSRLGAEGLPIVAAVARDLDADPTARVVAVDGLRHIPGDEARRCLIEVVERDLAELFASLDEYPVARNTLIAAVAALGERGEVLLGELLAWEPPGRRISFRLATPRDHIVIDPRLAVVMCLERIGTNLSLGPLRKLASERGWPNARANATRSAVKRAIESIEGRIGPVHGGRLSVVDDDQRRGALSPPIAGGRLSLGGRTDQS